MGWKASMIIIQDKEGYRDEAALLAALGLADYEYAGTTLLDECLMPGDNSVNIGYYNGCIIVCDDCLVVDEFITGQLTRYERQLATLFPRSEILAVACINTTNFHGYALLRNGEKVRVKSLNADDGFYYDWGEPIEEEVAIYRAGRIIDGRRGWTFENLPEEVFREDQLLEEFTFGVASRLLGVRIDSPEGDQLMEEVVFRKYIKKGGSEAATPQAFSMKGQWAGYFEYGPEYGEELAGERVQFRLFIEEGNNSAFEGRSVETEGVGANFEQALVKGFVEGDFISFTKQYPHYYGFEEDGSVVEDKSKAHPVVCYQGHYDAATGSYSGVWELAMDIEPVGDGWMEYVCTGKWAISRDAESGVSGAH